MKIPGFHRRWLAGLILLIVLGVQMGWLDLNLGTQGSNTMTTSTTETHRSALSGSQPNISLINGPGIGHTRKKEAQKTVDRLWGSVYAISDRETKTQLAKTAQIGTDMRFMLENKPFSYANKTYDSIEQIAKKYPNFYLQNDEILQLKYLHAKYFLFDESAIIQTSNLTRSGLYKNLEHAVLIRDLNIIKSLEYLFQNDRKGEPIDLSKIDPHLVICPINCRAVIEQMISSAQRSIDIMTQYIYDPALVSLLKKSPSDTKLRLLLSDSAGNTDLVDYFGDKVAQMHDNRQQYLHTKTILIDDRRLLIGSMNLSQNSLDNNREIGIIITDPIQIEKFKRGFEKYWKGK